MQYTTRWDSPLGEILLAADELGLTGLWFVGSKYCAERLDPEHAEGKLPVLREAQRWLKVYFSGKQPDSLPPLHPVGTPFQSEVWDLLLRIPYGCTATYGELAGRVAARRGLKRMSAQAVGGAVGHNPISLMIPCHRVVGASGSLTGYAGGIARKLALLKLEGVNLSGLTIPTRGTAL